MKKFFLPFCFIVFSLSCSNENLDNNIENTTSILSNPEEAFPNKEKVLLELNNGINIEKADSIYIYQGDILLTQEQVEILSNENEMTKAAYLLSKTWPSGVYFAYNNNVSEHTKQIVEQAMEHYKINLNDDVSKGHLRIQFKYSNKSTHVEIINGDGNYATLGYPGSNKKATLSLDKNASVGTAIHELGHILGLTHEQCRNDRDQYIIVNYNNIQSAKRHNFEIDKNTTTDGSFDFNSIMLYSSYNSFAIDTYKPTMTKKDGSIWYAQRQRLSNMDIKALKSLYKEKSISRPGWNS